MSGTRVFMDKENENMEGLEATAAFISTKK